MLLVSCFLEGNHANSEYKEDQGSVSPVHTPLGDKQNRDRNGKDPKKPKPPTITPSQPIFQQNTIVPQVGLPQAASAIIPKMAVKQESTSVASSIQPLPQLGHLGVQLVPAVQGHSKTTSNTYYGNKDPKKTGTREYTDSRQSDRSDRQDRDSGRDSRDNHRDNKNDTRGTKKHPSKRRSSSSSSRGKRRDDKPYLDKRVDSD